MQNVSIGTASLEMKFCKIGEEMTVSGLDIEGYASLFGELDQGGDIVAKGAYTACLARMGKEGRRVKMLWQHAPNEPIGIWTEVREDDRGLWVKGRLLDSVARAREAAALIEAGALDGLSIGYRTVRSAKNSAGERILTELELWEVSLVTFPMLQGARVGAKGENPADTAWRELAQVFEAARATLNAT